MTSDLHVNLLYPDPFRPAGLEFNLPEAAVVSVTLTDAEGNAISSPYDRIRLPAGRHALSFSHDPTGGRARYANLFVELPGETLRVVKPL